MVSFKSAFSRFLAVLTFIIVAAGQHAAAEIEEMLHKSYRDRLVIFQDRYRPRLLALPPADRVPVIERWLKEARGAGDHGAELELQISRDKFLEEAGFLSADGKLAIQRAMLKSLDKRKYPEYAIRLMHDIGNLYFRNGGDLTLAFEQFINAYNLSKELGSENFPDKKDLVVSVGNRYYLLGDFDRARLILLEADTMQWDRPRINRYNIRNTLGLIARATGRYDSAIRYFQTAEQLAMEDSDTLWAAIARGNAGITHYLRGDYPKAIPLLEDDIARSLRHLSLAEDNGVNSLLILADIHFRQGLTDQVGRDLARAQSWFSECHDEVKPRSLFFALQAKYLARRGDFHGAYLAQDSATFYKDSILALDNVFKVARMALENDMSRQENQLRRVDSERRLAVYTRNSLMAGMGLLGIIAFLGVSRQRLRNRERHRKLVRERELAERELQNASEQLAAYTRHLHEKNDLIERSTDEIRKLQNVIVDSRNADVKNDVLQQLYNSTILTDDEWSNFKRLFEQVHKGYLQHLKDKLPELTPADTRFLVLHKLALSSKEMSAILGVAPETIRSYRHRLRKRFEQSDDAEIRELISGI